MTELWLVRHGQTDWNLAGRWQGQSPHAPGLNETGQKQALALCDQLRDVHLDAIYSSDLLRARQTAELIAEPRGLTVILEPRLREINLGAWEGLFLSEVETRYPLEMAERKHDPLHARAPKGESPLEAAERILVAVNDIAAAHANKNILIVAHGISLAIIVCIAQGIPLEHVYENIPENAEPIRVKWEQR